MLPGAGVCRAIGVIAAVVLSVSSVLAQDDAARIVENFAQDAKRAEARKVEAGRKEADNRRKTEPRKSQESELRKQAAAQYAEAAARRKAAETRAAEEREMLERARQEADEQKATAEIRQLIEEAEAARLRAESVLAENAEQAPDVNTVQTSAKSSNEQHKKQAPPAVRRVRESVVADASAAEQARAQAVRTAEHQRRLKHLTRARQVLSARQQAREQRVADEREAQRVRDEMVKHALARAEARRAQASLARVVKSRQARAAQAQALASADAARNQALANAAEEAQARLRVEAERAQQAQAAARPQAQMNDESTTGEVTAVGSKALSPPAFEGPSREAGYRPVQPQPVAGEPSYAPRREPGVEWNGQVTVLMIMAPGTYGIRRGARTADPVLCTADGCYVSTGSDSPAVFMPRRKALGFGNTFGRRAWACRQQLGCIFRGVPFDYPATLQPVDLHILKHDRRRPQVVLADSHCRVAAHQLMCSRAIRGDDYIMWVVPEGLAERAGPELLERALRGGLNPLRSADAYSAR